jgi:hypothetical protein
LMDAAGLENVPLVTVHKSTILLVKLTKKMSGPNTNTILVLASKNLVNVKNALMNNKSKLIVSLKKIPTGSTFIKRSKLKVTLVAQLTLALQKRNAYQKTSHVPNANLLWPTNVTESTSTHTWTIAEKSPIHTTTCTGVTTNCLCTVTTTKVNSTFFKDSTLVATKLTTLPNNVLVTLETVSTTGETSTSFHTTLTDNTTTWLAQPRLATILLKNGRLAVQPCQKLVKTTNFTVFTKGGALSNTSNKVASVQKD